MENNGFGPKARHQYSEWNVSEDLVHTSCEELLLPGLESVFPFHFHTTILDVRTIIGYSVSTRIVMSFTNQIVVWLVCPFKGSFCSRIVALWIQYLLPI